MRVLLLAFMSLSKSSRKVKRDTDDNDDECVYQKLRRLSRDFCSHSSIRRFIAKALKWRNSSLSFSSHIFQ